jgi:hypothetical protein
MRVCRIEQINAEGKVVGGGTGFHYGGGWIVTNSHVVGRNSQDLRLSRITFEHSQPRRVFQPRDRVCFFVDITYDAHGSADCENPDIAVFWLEEEELQSTLPAMNDTALRAVPVNTPPPELKKGSQLRCLHYGWGAGDHPPTIMLDSASERVTAVEHCATKLDIAWRNGASTSGGSSGAPVFTCGTGELVGVHFAGAGDVALAVVFDTTVRAILQSLILKIASVRSIKGIIAVHTSMENPTPGLVTSLKDRLQNVINILRAGKGHPLRVLLPLPGGTVLHFTCNEQLGV